MIPKSMTVIWIGNQSLRPDKWINTWRDKHPDWKFRIVGNDELYGRKWQGQHVIDAYLSENCYPAVADVMRYNLLYDEGGFGADADSECLEPIDELLGDNQALAVYENEQARAGWVSPLQASVKGGHFAKALLDNLPDVVPKGRNPIRGMTLERPVFVTGNAYMKRIIANYTKLTGRAIADDLKILPSHTLIPIHYTGARYDGDGKVYAVQKWGDTSKRGKGVISYDW